MSAIPYCACCGLRWTVTTAGIRPTCGCMFEPSDPVDRRRRLDEFARAALAGILAAPSDAISQDLGPNARGSAEHAAMMAYVFAEAMISESNKRAAQPGGTDDA